MTKVSVIVPVYNVEQYLRKCLDSLVNQTLKDIEIIIVDDGSEDASSHIAKEYEKQYSNVKYYRKENGGLSDARNYGLKYATGKYIAFLDSDDYVDKTLYQKMYEKAKKEDSDMVECNFYWSYPRKNKKDIGEKYYGKKQMLEKARVVAWNKLYKKEIIDKAKVEFPKGLIYEDVEFFYKLVPYIENVSFVKEPLIYYVQRVNSIVNKQGAKTKQIFMVLDNVIEYYRKINLYNEYEPQIEYTYSRLLLCSSLKRMIQIPDKLTRKLLLEETWQNLNTKFPNWKKNELLKKNNTVNGLFMKTMNNITFKIYTKVLRLFWR